MRDPFSAVLKGLMLQYFAKPPCLWPFCLSNSQHLHSSMLSFTAWMQTDRSSKINKGRGGRGKYSGTPSDLTALLYSRRIQHFMRT